MYSICAVLLLIVAIEVGDAGGDSHSGIDLPSSDIKYIETVLANISAQLATFRPGKVSTDVGESLTSVTSLLQLSLLREVLTEYRVDSSTSDAMEAIATLSRMEELLNGSIINQQTILMDIKKQGNANGQAISSLQKQVTSTLNNIKTNLQLLLQQNLTEGHIYSSSKVLHSCEEIKTNWPDSPSDYYTIADSNGHTRHVYCHMEEMCGSDEGWIRVAYLNMSDPTEDCPSGFRLYEENGIRACGRPETTVAYCQPAVFPASHINYTEVCGRMIGYQYGRPGGINPYFHTDDINSPYVEGVSLTYGSPRQHIWTFINAIQENTFWHNDGGERSCPCAPNSGISNIAPPSFVGNDYFCESGAPITAEVNTFYTNDPLWDGKQCGIKEKPCCNFPGLPWFHKELQISTNEDIEMRLCANQGTNIEDTPINFFEIYVK